MNKITDIANTIVDDVQAIADSPLISLIGLVLPQANSIIDVVRRYRPVIDAAQPAITAAVEAGVPVFEAAVKAAPKFASAVSAIMALAPAHVGDAIGAALKVENIARVIGGHGRMTPEQEAAWMDAATPHNDPSQENSRYGSG